MKLFKVIASKAGRVVFDDRVQAESPREAREQMKTLMGLQSLTGVVYAVTEIPIELIESIVDARIALALHRVQGGQPPEGVEALIRPIAGEEVRMQLAGLRVQMAGSRTPDAVNATAPANGARYDAFTASTEVPVAEHILGNQPAATTKRKRRARPAVTTNGTEVDWKAVKRHYLRTRSHKQTAAHFELSPNTVKARCRREGWGA